MLSYLKEQLKLEITKSLRGMRLQRKEVDVLVETAERWKPHKKPKKKRIAKVEPSKRLDTFFK